MYKLNSTLIKFALALTIFVNLFTHSSTAKEIRIGLVVKGLGIGFFEAAAEGAAEGGDDSKEGQASFKKQ